MSSAPSARCLCKVATAALFISLSACAMHPRSRPSEAPVRDLAAKGYAAVEHDPTIRTTFTWLSIGAARQAGPCPTRGQRSDSRRDLPAGAWRVELRFRRALAHGLGVGGLRRAVGSVARRRRQGLEFGSCASGRIQGIGTRALRRSGDEPTRPVAGRSRGRGSAANPGGRDVMGAPGLEQGGRRRLRPRRLHGRDRCRRARAPRRRCGRTRRDSRRRCLEPLCEPGARERSPPAIRTFTCR